MALNISADKVNEINDAANAPRDFAPVPDGKYCASLVSAEDSTREAKNGNTLDYIKCHFKLEGGEFNNRREFADLVYSNSGSEQHGEIGVKQLTQLFKALGGTGDLNATTLANLAGKCVELTIKTTPSKDPQYGPRRNYYYNPCKDCPSDCCSDGACPADGGGDIWS